MQDLILLHGALGDRSTLAPLAEILSLQFNLFVPDFSGHGMNGPGSHFTMTDLAGEIAALIRREGLQRPGIFGYSMGGYAALLMASKNPHLAGAIMTLGTKFGWTREVAEQESRMLNPDAILEKVPSFASILQGRHGDHWPEVCRSTARMVATLSESEPIAFTQIDCPVLISLGSLDKMVTEAESRAAAKAIPGGHFRSLQDVPHPIEKANPGTVADALISFLL